MTPLRQLLARPHFCAPTTAIRRLPQLPRLLHHTRPFSVERHRDANRTRGLGIVGGGIVGIACAREMQKRHPSLDIILFEKGDRVAGQQTGHNSGVIHSGIYYGIGSRAARLCVEGNALMYRYCDEKRIPYEKCGKLIVAVDPDELPRLHALYENGKGNGVPDMHFVEGTEAIRAIEPHCNGLAAVMCKSTGIVNYTQVAEALLSDFLANGGEVQLSTKVTDITDIEGKGRAFHDGVRVHTADGGSYPCEHLITCAGAYSDKLAVMTGCDPYPLIVPVRGEYLRLKERKRHLVKGNIYPVPDPRVPFLGVHFTPHTNGDLLLGPNAVLAFAREGYTYSTVKWKEITEIVLSEGFARLALRVWDFGLDEFYRSIFTTAQVNRLRKYIPSITVADVEPGPAGVRAVALDRAGELVKDFLFDSGEELIGTSHSRRILHVRNAPSPAATSSLAIAAEIASESAQRFRLTASTEES